MTAALNFREAFRRDTAEKINIAPVGTGDHVTILGLRLLVNDVRVRHRRIRCWRGDRYGRGRKQNARLQRFQSETQCTTRLGLTTQMAVARENIFLGNSATSSTQRRERSNSHRACREAIGFSGITFSNKREQYSPIVNRANRF